MNDGNPRRLRLNWPRFSLVLVFALVIINGMGLLGGKATIPLRVPMAFLSLSVVGYATFRFQTLRRHLSAGTLSDEELRGNFQRHFLGPLLPRAVWLVVTTAVFLGLILFEAG